MAIQVAGDFDDTNNTVYLSGRKTVNTTGISARVGISNDENRQFVRIYNDSSSTVYFGPSGLSTTDMEPLLKKQAVEIAVRSEIDVIIKTSSGTADVIIQEIG